MRLIRKLKLVTFIDDDKHWKLDTITDYTPTGIFSIKSITWANVTTINPQG